MILKKDARDSGRATHPIACNKGKEPIVPNDVDTPAGDELSSGSSPSLSLSLAKNARDNTKAKLRKRPSHHLAFNDAISGTSYRARREASRGQNHPDRVPRNAYVLPAGIVPLIPLVHPAFSIGPTFYMLPIALIRGPDDMLSSPLRQHILDYEPPRGSVIPTFATFDGYVDPFNHMLHYNQAMILNAGNDCLLCKVFPGSD